MPSRFKDWLPVVGLVVTIFLAYRAELGPLALAWLNGVEAWRFAFVLALCGWAIYGLYRCKAWIEQRIAEVSAQTTELFNRVSGIAKGYDNQFDKLGRAVETLQRSVKPTSSIAP
jgi:hypothetical protein